MNRPTEWHLDPEPESNAEYETAGHHKQWADETDALDTCTTTEGATSC